LNTNPPTGRETVVYDAIDAFQRTHRLPGLQHAQIRSLLAEHLARVLPAAFAALEPAVPPADRAAVLREAAEAIEAEQAREEATEWAQQGELDHETEIGGGYVRHSAALLRRLAVEAQPEASPLGGRKTGTAFSPGEGVHGQDPYYDGTETPQPDTETETPCGPAPDTCDAEAGEPCANHEREQAHAEGEHCFCGPECPDACTCADAGDCFVPLGHYRDCPAAAPEPHPTEADVRHALAVLDQFESRDAAPAAGSGRAADTHNDEEADRIVAYRSRDGRSLYCTRHAGEVFGTTFTPVTSEDLPDGGTCTYPECGADVLIPQEASRG